MKTNDTPDDVLARRHTPPPDLDAIRARCEAASKGPCIPSYVPSAMPVDCVKYGVVSLSKGLETARCWTVEDTIFYAAAHEDIPALLAHIDTLTRERDEASARNGRLQKANDVLDDTLGVATDERDTALAANATLTAEVAALRGAVDAQFEQTEANKRWALRVEAECNKYVDAKRVVEAENAALRAERDALAKQSDARMTNLCIKHHDCEEMEAERDTIRTQLAAAQATLRAREVKA